MKILLINNHTVHLDDLTKALAGHDVEMQFYQPGLDFHYQDKDLVILSGGGGEGLEIYDHYERGKLWYEDQMRFIRSIDKPVIGICMGFEVICSAYGERIRYMNKLIEGYKKVGTTDAGYELIGQRALTQFESHCWQVQRVSEENFEVLARSDTGVEMIRHKKKPIIGVQFHPEKPNGSLHLKDLVNSFAHVAQP